MLEQTDDARDRDLPKSHTELVGVRSSEMATCTGVRGALGKNGVRGDAGLPSSLDDSWLTMSLR